MKMTIYENISLKPYNTFGIDVKTCFFIELMTEEDIFSFYSASKEFPQPFIFLGGGSNMLFTKDFTGTVIRLCTRGIKIIEEDNDSVVVCAASGENWDAFVKYCVDKGWGGVENLSMIPGNVGTAPVQNIGAYGVELKDSFLELEAITTDALEKVVFSREQCEFGYRDSIFKGKGRGKYFILNVSFLLSKHPELKLDYGNIREELHKMDKLSPTISDVREAVCRIRQSKLPDPGKIGNAGSFFKNPVVSRQKFIDLKDQFPGIGSYLQDDGYKIAAAWMIEQCGWKGKRSGDAGVHENQPLVLVNYGSATGKEILDLANRIIDSIERKFRIRLEPEVNIY
jgi:UDP-N-acetylmuramate dehydrogenase